MVHRLLAASLKLEPLPWKMRNLDLVSAQCERMTERHMNAQDCSRDSSVFFAFRLFRTLGDGAKIKVAGVVLSVRRNGCSIVAPKWGVSGNASVRSEDYSFDASSQTLTSLKVPELSIGVFDHVLVSVDATDDDFRYQVQYEILGRLTEDDRQIANHTNLHTTLTTTENLQLCKRPNHANK